MSETVEVELGKDPHADNEQEATLTNPINNFELLIDLRNTYSIALPLRTPREFVKLLRP